MMSRGTLSIHVIDLPPEGIDLAGEVEFAELDIQDDGVFSYPTPVSFDLRIAPIQDSVLVRGHLRGHVVRVCDRCLEPGDLPMQIEDVCHLFEHATGTVIDLTDVLREDILLAFPQAWLCRADCKGLCHRCGRNLNERGCSCGDDQPGDDGENDDPWGPLDGLIVRDNG